MNHTNLQYCVELDYERSQCTCNESICRCTTIEKSWITKIDANEVIKKLMPKKCVEIDAYCFDRICRANKIWDKDNYNIVVCGGYYGEEIDGVYFDNEETIDKCFNEVKTLTSDIKKIKYVLNLEYGYLLDKISKCTNATIVEVPSKLVVVPQNEYYRKLENDVVNSYGNYKLPCAVCIKNDTKYCVIDGYHRVAANKNNKKMRIIILN